MRTPGKYIYMWEVCFAKEFGVSDNDLRLFIESNPNNCQCTSGEFDVDLRWSSMMHWNAGDPENTSYYIYRNEEGNMFAWYDGIKQIGFKAER